MDQKNTGQTEYESSALIMFITTLSIALSLLGIMVSFR